MILKNGNRLRNRSVIVTLSINNLNVYKMKTQKLYNSGNRYTGKKILPMLMEYRKNKLIKNHMYNTFLSDFKGIKKNKGDDTRALRRRNVISTQCPTNDAVSQRNAPYICNAAPLPATSPNPLSNAHALRRRALFQRSVWLKYNAVATTQRPCGTRGAAAFYSTAVNYNRNTYIAPTFHGNSKFCLANTEKNNKIYFCYSHMQIL